MTKIFFILLYFFWFFSQVKKILFWLYLWQIKEYRFDRFLDHFRTFKGKRIFLNPVFLLKIFALPFYFVLPKFFLIFIFSIFFVEAASFFLNLIEHSLLRPVFTKKILLLSLMSFFFCFLPLCFLGTTVFFFFLILFDILLPAFVSFFVLLFQPITYFFKLYLIEKAKKKREKFSELIVIGITGSYGKTSTKEFLATILSEKFQVLKTKENQNNEVSVAKCVLEDLKKEHQIFVCEMGAYKKGEIKILANLVKPKVALLTGVNEQHLSLFGSMENLISAEGGKELVESLPDDGLVIVNSQNPILRNLAFEISKRKVLVSEEGFEDVSIKDLIVGKNFLSFEISLFSEGNSLKVNLPLIGRQNLQNLLLAICAAKNLKMTWKEIEGGLKKIKMDQGRILLKKGKNGVDILESTYSTNPSAVFSHLEHLKLWEGKRIIILPCLIELGEKAREIHFEIGKNIKEVCDFGILITRDYFEEVKSGAGDKVIFLDDKDKILERLEPFFEKNNVILVEGRIPKKILQILY